MALTPSTMIGPGPPPPAVTLPVLPVTAGELRTDVDALFAGRDILGDQRPCMGCNIKWKRRGTVPG